MSQVFSSAGGTSELVDPAGKRWSYAVESSNYAWAKVSAGLKLRPTKAAEIYVEGSRYFLEGFGANYGVKGEFRYRF